MNKNIRTGLLSTILYKDYKVVKHINNKSFFVIILFFVFIQSNLFCSPNPTQPIITDEKHTSNLYPNILYCLKKINNNLYLSFKELEQNNIIMAKRYMCAEQNEENGDIYFFKACLYYSGLISKLNKELAKDLELARELFAFSEKKYKKAIRTENRNQTKIELIQLFRKSIKHSSKKYNPK